MCALKNCFMYDENVTDRSICILSDSQGLLRHLKKLQLCSSHVSSAVIDILEEINLAYERKCKSITFKWIPGHSGLGYNPRADRLASKAYKQDPCPTSVPIPVKTLQHVATRRMDDQLWCYLDQSVCSSEDDLNPPRDAFKSCAFMRNEIISDRQDVTLFRLRSGHNRLNHHLARFKMVKAPNCRYCNFCEEDGYQIVMKCQKIPNLEKFNVLQDKSGVLCREDWNEWLFSKRDRSLTRKFMDIVLSAKIEV